MGINYYLNYNVCPQCKHPEKQIHIGQKAPGWSFVWHAYKSGESFPFTRSVQTRMDWANFITELNIAQVPMWILDSEGKRIDEVFSWVLSWPAPDKEQYEKEMTKTFFEQTDARLRDEEGFRFMDGWWE